MCAAAGVDSAECSADAGVLLDEGDAFLQIAAAEKDVVEHGRHLVDERSDVGSLPLAFEKQTWSDERRSCKGYERSAWDRSHRQSQRGIITYAPHGIAAIGHDANLDGKKWRAGSD